MLKKVLYGWLFLAITMLNYSCYKTLVPSKSDKLDVQIDAAQSNISLNPIFPVNIKIFSRLFARGVSIENIVSEEVSGLLVEPQTPIVNTLNADNNTVIINLPRQKWCLVSIKITDNGDPNNVVVKTFRVVYK